MFYFKIILRKFSVWLIFWVCILNFLLTRAIENDITWALINLKMKKCSYSYLVIPIGEDGENAYKAIVPKFSNLCIMADSPEELHELVIEMIQEDIARRRKEKEKIPEPDYIGKFNGQILIRTQPAIHEKLYFEARANNLSLNKYIEGKLKG